MVAQTVKNPPMIQDKWVWSLGQEDPLKKGMATHSSSLVRRIPGTEEVGRLLSMGLQRVGHDWVTEPNWTERLPTWHSDKEAAWQCRRGKRCRFNPWFSSERFPGVGNGNPLPYSCLGNSMNRGVWRATVTKGSQRIRHDWAHTQRLK